MEKTLKFTIPEGYEIDKEHSTDSEIVYKLKESTFSKSWEEFCNKHVRVVENEAYITPYSNITAMKVSGVRNPKEDKNLFPSRYGEAFLALMHLLTIREREYIPEGWKPAPEEYAYVIYYSKATQKIVRDRFYSFHTPLSFPSLELRNKFFENWKGLIEVAKELI